MIDVSPKNEEAVTIILDSQNLSEEIYEEHDLSTLEDLLIEQIEPSGIGVFDGNEVGPMGTSIYLYGTDAEKLFTTIQPLLEKHPLCQNSKAVIRRGGPGATQREVRLPFNS